MLAVLRRLTGAFWRSTAVAALFALHPLRIESVAWAAERKDVLSGLFFLLAIWRYLGYVRQPSKRRYYGVCGMFALGLLAKPMVMTLPVDSAGARLVAARAARLRREVADVRDGGRLQRHHLDWHGAPGLGELGRDALLGQRISNALISM